MGTKFTIYFIILIFGGLFAVTGFIFILRRFSTDGWNVAPSYIAFGCFLDIVARIIQAEIHNKNRNI
ncbi:MAG TPA: hypothetical protein PK253_17615 [Spirochaetota bacterium]|nr:hypothetical protein [Spirochaetota bacterium]